MRAFTTFMTVGALVSPITADWQFRSRPDLAPPRLNITIPAADSVEKGFIFVAPYAGFEEGNSGLNQPGAYIFRDDGELVWSSIGYYAGWLANFRPDTWNGQQYLRGFQGLLDGHHGRMFGYHTLLGSDYEAAKVVRVGPHRLVSAHEFRLVDGKTALVETPIPRPVSLKPWGGSEDQTWIISAGFQGMLTEVVEIDIETGEIIFEWESLDHVDPNAFPLDFGEGLPGGGRTEADGWNYFHVNSVDKDDEGNYLVSARNTAAVFKINGTSGDIIWQLGGFHGGYQHHARFRSRSADGKIEIISLFDNGTHSTSVKTNPFSRGRIYQLNHTDGTAKALKTYNAPDRLSAHTQGNFQVLPNGNAFINWGQAGAVTEYSNDGDVLFHAYLDSAPEGHLVQSYQEPAIVAFSGKDSVIDVYVSWNGGTEAASWRFSSTSAVEADARLLGEIKRDGFETHFTFSGRVNEDNSLVFAQAVSASGKILGQTRATTISRNELSPPSTSVQWSEEL
ncbi:ASST-domain-containing protein [Colletotrichum phormii]|uniref:ASST-domain-containing protein n=1 Tax=Colletotrichum phormii TaxID=359342 RepID=A0AAI9ZJN8_9PEZI|nr:ASST-domain-containing protein [Colletotrichum phormii]KAK1633223.1 ASST-domain-containing protein [Colletotrichum phormii]